jgi:hypothetical protein
MQPHTLAKRRSSRRSRDAGAAMFIVAMMITVLATVGLFALAAASTEVKTAGNERQNTQTHYLAEYGVVAMANISTAANAQGILGIMLAPNPDGCISLPIPSMVAATSPFDRACHRFEPAEFVKLGTWASGVPPTVAYAGTTPYQSSIPAPGSLGPVPTTAGFFVETTDPSSLTGPPGYQTGLLCFLQFTATAAGVTLPTFAGSVAYDDMGVETQRARIVAGPIPCPSPQQ